MIRMIQNKSASGAKSYFATELNQADYYINDQELKGRFQGKLAERLGLGLDADKDTFFALCENTNPKTGENLTWMTKDNRTVGYDINFHCPKSVSIVHALSGNRDILDLFEQSVSQTMREIEQDVMTRVRKDGAYFDRKTSELVWAEFTHQTARPVEGYAPDPHLHAHCFVFNATFDKEENKYKAAQFREIMRDMPYHQARFHKVLSDKLILAGYDIERTKSSFEITGVPKRVIEHFSKRTNEIGQIAKEKGITDAKDLDGLGARTRGKKQKGLSMTELRQEWRKQIRELETAENLDSDPDYNGVIRKTVDKNKLPVHDPKNVVDFTLNHVFTRASVVPERRLQAQAYRYAVGQSGASVDQIDQAVFTDNRIIRVKENGRTVCTTKAVLTEEKEMVDLARKGLGKAEPLYKEAPALDLTGQQKNAVEHILTTRNRVSIVRGAAGSGKTTLMKVAAEKIEATGKKLTVIAPTAQASRGVLKDEGFNDANTVAKFLVDQDMQAHIKDQVLWVDEAGLLGTGDMKHILQIVEEQNTRLILGGDTRQHASVVRGDALRILNTVGKIQTAEVNKIFRQRTESYRDAVQDLAKGHVRTAFGKLDNIGSIKEIDPADGSKQLVDDYVAALKKGKTGLIISPTHKQGEEVTAAVRKELKKEGLIGKREIVARKLANTNMTEAEKSDYRLYKKGQVIQFNQNMKGVKRGSAWTVENVDETNIHINNGNEQISVPVTASKKFDVFEDKEIALSLGDKFQITKNGFDKHRTRLDNGQALQVKSVSKKDGIVLINPVSKNLYYLDKDFGHISHAHCITSYASQGKTVDEVFIHQPAATFPATDAKQFYVSVSRGRDNVHIYTDDKEQLLEYASEMGDRKSALELVGEQYGFIRDRVAGKDKPKDKNKDIEKEFNRNNFTLDYE
ncbi:MAG: relaxase domain-containing protein [Flavobacterium lindanitolerans]|uniref:MobF family relaxase n=1 Tax=Flavobacterium lindanitolerans TaxID=428988 RepID=UPI001A41C8B7|nr:MobF family relaxase [Flavobacterium lindanitolerans]MBL7867384.1 relaxase domain-containing protein [Flavobacterium lindanitolerans]